MQQDADRGIPLRDQRAERPLVSAPVSPTTR